MLCKLVSMTGGQGSPCPSLLHHDITDGQRSGGMGTWKTVDPSGILNRKTPTYLQYWELSWFPTQMPWQQGPPCSVLPKCEFLYSRFELQRRKNRGSYWPSHMTVTLSAKWFPFISSADIYGVPTVCSRYAILAPSGREDWHVSSYTVELRVPKPVENFYEFIWVKLTTYAREQGLKCSRE